MTQNEGGTTATTNAKNIALTILLLVLTVGLWKILDATASYIIDARATSASVNQVIYEYRNAVGDVGGKMAELIDAQIQVASAVEESVRSSSALIDESKGRIAWAAQMMENLFPAQAQESIGGVLEQAVGTLSNALDYLMEHPDDVRGAIQALIQGIMDAKPFQTMGEGLGPIMDTMVEVVEETVNPCGG
ncbi:hypothetical protein H8D30_01500 [bacterium]|nr:hypothetical protein [bacterium]